MSYVQRTFYVGQAPEGLDNLDLYTLQWISFTSTDVNALPAFPISATLVAGGNTSITIERMFDDNGREYYEGNNNPASGMLRVKVSEVSSLSQGTITIGATTLTTDDVLPKLLGTISASPLGPTDMAFYYDMSTNVPTSTLIDQTTNGVDATWNTVPSFVDGYDGATSGAPNITADFHRAVISQSTHNTILASTTFTISCWVRLTDPQNANEYIFTNYDYGSGGVHVRGFTFFYLGNPEFKFRLTLGNGTIQGVASTTTPVADTWYHICATYDGTTARLYVDGTEEAFAVLTYTPPLPGDNNAFINTFENEFGTNVGPMTGRVDEVKFWIRALSASEVQGMYNEDTGVIPGNEINPNYDGPYYSSRGNTQVRNNWRTLDTAFSPRGDFAVGVPAPVWPPQVTVTSPGNPTDLETDTRFYLMTYINQLGYESAPGPVTPNAVHVDATTSVKISYPLFADVAYHPALYGKRIVQDYVPVTAARIYRTNTGTAETGFQFVAELALVDFPANIDDVENDQLGELLVTDGWDVPPPVVTAGCKMANGTYVLVHEFNVYFSVPSVTYAYPALFTQVIRNKAQHIVPVAASAIMLTDGGPYLIAGGAPDTMEVIKLPFNQVCQSVRAVATYLDLCIYPAQDGLIGVSATGQVQNLTENIFEEDQWRAEVLAEGEIMAEVYDSVYYGLFKDNDTTTYVGFSFDLKNKNFSWMDTEILSTDSDKIFGMLYDGSTDSLYLTKNDRSLMEWNPSDEPQLICPPSISDLTPRHYWRLDETVHEADDTPYDNWKTHAVDSMGNGDLYYFPGRAEGTGILGTTTSLRGDGAGTAWRSSTGRSVAALQDEQTTFFPTVGQPIGVGGAVTPFSIALLCSLPSTYINQFEFIVGSVDYYGNVASETYDTLWGIRRISSTDRLEWVVEDSSGTVHTADMSNDTMANDGLHGVAAVFGLTVNGNIVTLYINNAVYKQVTVAGWDGTIQSSAEMSFCIGGAAGSNAYPPSMTFDEVAFFDRVLTLDDIQVFYSVLSSGGGPSECIAPVWKWWSKQFTIPSRSYGAVKLRGKINATDRVQVVLEIDGVDQPLFQTKAEFSAGEVGAEDPFRLPPVRGERMRLKFKTAAGAPEIESVQVSVHPSELV